MLPELMAAATRLTHGVAQVERRPSVSYMDELQSDINATMRGILVDWLV